MAHVQAKKWGGHGRPCRPYAAALAKDPRTGDPRTGDLRTRGPGTQGPGIQQSSSVALSFYDRNTTCVNVLSSNVRLYRCWSQSPHCYTYTQLTLFTPDCAISHYLLAFFIYSPLCKSKNSLLYCMQGVTSSW